MCGCTCPESGTSIHKIKVVNKGLEALHPFQFVCVEPNHARAVPL